ncbi:MAG: DUF3784 domain-containing protein [Clostridia bacterium]|nr:DUF3784 domain-containing protein [Clostridia bacterium]
MKHIVVALVLVAVALVLAYLSIRSFMGKGLLLNNSYLYASKQERERMNKKPYYIQSGVVFALFAVLMLVNAVEALLHTTWLFIVVMALVVVTTLYAILSSMLIKKNNK